jgi:hypothetical protein
MRPSRLRWSWGRGARRVLAAALLVAGAGGQLSCTPRCEAPYPPVGVRSSYPPVDIWPVTGTPRPPVLGPFDSDGDGVADTVTQTDDRRSVTVSRASGDLVLVAPADRLLGYTPDYVINAGDLDGDGGDDMRVEVMEVLPGGGAGPTTEYLVASGTPDGTYVVTAVGAAVTFGGGPLQGRAGDVDNDGHDDVAGLAPAGDSFVTLVWSGADVDLTPGAAADVSSRWSIDGAQAVMPVPLDGRDGLVLRSQDPSGHVLLTVWLPEGRLTFTTEGMDVSPIAVYPPAMAIVDDGAQRWLTAAFPDRSGPPQLWAWDLDDLCAGAPAASPE